MRELVELQINDQIAAQKPIVEDEVEEVVVAVEGESLLPRLEEKAFAQLQKEFFEVRDNGRFEIGLGVAGFFVQPQEFQHQGILQNVFGRGDDLAFLGQFANADFVSAEGEALVEAGGFLAFQLADIPVRLS